MYISLLYFSFTSWILYLSSAIFHTLILVLLSTGGFHVNIDDRDDGHLEGIVRYSIGAVLYNPFPNERIQVSLSVFTRESKRLTIITISIWALIVALGLYF